MKHITSKLLSLLLCLAMLMSMVPVAYADDTERTGVDNNVSISEDRSEDSVKPSDDETKTPVSGSAVATSEELATAIANAEDGDTITLGEGEFTTYGNTSPNKSLTFVGAGEKTVWTIGNLTANVGGEGNGDYSFDGCDTITFKNMTLKSDGADYRGFIRINNTVVENCTLEGKTAYWGYTTATFTDCTFEAPEGDYALWDYSTPSMTFNNCTFNISGKGINVYVEAGNAGNVTRTVAVNGCTVDSTKANKAFLNIKNSTQSYDVTFSGTNTVTGLNADDTTNSALYQVEATEVTEISGKPVKVQEKAADGTLTPLYEVKAAAQSTAVAKVDNVEYSTLQAAIDAAKDRSTVRLLDNVTLTEPAVFPAGKTVHINLVGHNITANGTALLINGTTDIQDTEKTGTIESTNNVAVAVGDNAKVTVYSGTLKGREGAVITSTSTGATIEIRKNATLIATDNAVIAGNGSNREGKPNTILVKGGTFIGNIESNGYIACGIYAPWNDNVTVSGGTFNITNGAGIVARAGTVKVTGGTFNCTGTSTGWVGDNKNLLPCAALVFDAAANYPALTESSQILVSGGSFSTDPAANGATLASGYVATLNESGMYGVNKANPVAEINGVKYDTLQAAITAAGATEGGATIKLLANINTSSYYEVKGANPVTIDLAGHNITGSGISGLFYVTAKGNLTIKGDGVVTAVEDNRAAMVVWVRSPIAKVTLEGGTYTQQITSTSDNHFDLIYVEYGTAYIKGGTYEGATPAWTLNCKDENYQSSEAKIEVTGGTFKDFNPANNTAEGENTNFVPAGYVSTKGVDGNFVVTEANYVAEVNGVKYETLQAAIEKANKGATVKLLADTKENVTISKRNVTLDLNGFTLNGSTGERKPALTITERYVTIMDSSAAQTGTIMREDTAENSGVSSYYVIDIQDNAFVTFKSGNVKNDSGAGGTKGASLVRIGTDDQPTWTPQLTIKGGTFTQNNFIVLKVGGCGTLYVNGGTINSENSYAVENWRYAVIKDQAVVNGKVSSWTYQNSLNKENELKIEGGTVNGDVEAVSYDGSAGKKASVSITGGTVNGALSTKRYNGTTEPTKDMATIEVTGGTFKNDPSKYVVEGSTATKNDDGTFGVAKAYLAQVGENSYYTMDEASAAQTTSGEAIVLLRDYTTGSPFSSGSIDRVVDLNGHTWTCTGKDANSAAFAINNPNVSLTVKNGKIVSSQLVGLIPSAMGGTIKYDNSNLVFDGVEMSTTATSGIETNGNNANDSVTLKNSTLNVPNGFGIYFPSSGKLTIENSTINAKTMGVQVCAGSLSINAGSTITVSGDAVPKTENDGAIQDGAAISIVNRTGYKGLGDITVTGGTFKANGTNAAIKAYDWNNANKKEDPFTESDNVAVSGGTFSSAVPEDLCAEGYEPIKNPDGTYGVKASTPVAVVNDVQYYTLKKAIAAAKDGDTVKLLADVSEDVTIGKSVTLDLGGKTLTNTNAGKATISVTGGTVTVKNGTVIGGTSYYNIEVTKGSNANLTLENVTATAGNTGSSMIDNWGTLTINSGSYTGGMNTVKSEEGSTLVINNGTFTCDYGKKWSYTATILVYGDTTINGGTFIQKTTNTSSYAKVVMTGIVEGYEAITRVTDGTFTNEKLSGIFYAYGKATSDNFEVSGGTFNKSVSEGYCADGFIPTKNADGTYGVKEGKYVAAVGSKKYETLADAIRLAAKGKTVTLLADVTLDAAVEVKANKNITLDLNGKKLSTTTQTGDNTRHYYAIDNYGTFTLLDSSTEQSGEISARGIENLNGGNMVIKSGKIVAVDANGGAAIWNLADLTIEGGTFEAKYEGTSGDTYGPGCVYNAGTLTINGGTFTSANKRTYAVVSKSGAVTIDPAAGKTVEISGAHGGLGIDGGTATIKGGSYGSSEYYGLYVSNDAGTAEVTVTGGTFDGNQYAVLIGSDGASSVNSTLKIEGGTFNKPIHAQGNTVKGAIQVSGGTFSSAVLPEYCATGFVPTENADGTFGVKVDTSVAEVNGKKYETLQEAIAAAKDGDTVKLLADVNTPDTSYYIDKRLTIDLNGKTVTGSGYDGVFSITGAGAEVCIKNGAVVAVEKKGDAGKYTMAVWAHAAGCTVTLEALTVSQQINHTDDKQMDMIYASAGTIIINSGSFTSGTPKWTLNINDSAYKDGSANIIVNGGTFVGYDPRNAENEGKGTSLVAEGVGINKDAAGNFTAVPNMAAQIVDENGGSVKAYATLQEAVDAAENGQTVKLLADTDITSNGLTIAASKSITLDLSGHRLKAANTDKGNIKVIGKLTLTDSTDTAKNGTGTGMVYTETPYIYGSQDKVLIAAIGGGTFIMESGLVDAASYITDNANNGQFAVSVQNDTADATVIINGGHIKAGWYAVAGNGNNVNYNGNITVNGGILESTADYAIYHPHVGTTTINGGTVYGAAGGVSLNRGKLVVNGGMITSKGTGATGNWGDGTGNQKAAAINVNAQYDTTSVEIKGGTITAEKDAILLTNGKNGTIAVSGGTFSSAVKPEYCAIGFEPKANGNGTYGVKAAEGNAAMFDAEGKLIGYKDVAAALANSNAKTVKLIKDATTADGVVFSNKALDLSGHVLTADYVVAFNGSVIDSEDGKGLLKADNLSFIGDGSNSSYIPLFDQSKVGYRFFVITEMYGYNKAVEGGARIYCAPTFTSDSSDAWELLKSSNASNAEIGIHLAITMQSGESSSTTKQDVVFDAKFVDMLCNQPTGALWVTIKNVLSVTEGEITSVTATPFLKSNSGAEVTGETYSIPVSSANT